MDLPVYEMVIDESVTSDIEVAAVALVDKPAIERNFLAFKDQKLYFAIDNERRIIAGPAMVADQLIYRKDENGEYNVFFSAATISQIQQKFFKKDYHKNLNLFHDPNLSVEGVTIYQSFVSDKSMGVKPMAGFEDLPDGSWFIAAKVENDEVWQKIKSGEVKGFSVEGIFSFMKKAGGLSATPFENCHFKEDNTIMSEINDLWSKFKEKFLGEIPNIPAAPAQTEKLAAEVTLKDGTVCTVDRMEVGGVMMKDNIPVAPGEYEISDGSKVTVAEGGVISAIAPATMDQNPAIDYSKQFEEVNTKFSDYEQKFQAHTQAFETMKAEFVKSQEQLKNLVELVGKIIETPTTETVAGSNTQFNSQKQTREQRIRDLSDTLSKLKKK